VCKRDSIIEKQLPELLGNVANIFHILPFNATHLINPFLYSRISANHDKKGEISANGEILIKWIVSLL
jgi:hypothetical protein